MASAQSDLPVGFDEKVNLALRRTADKLLRLEGDETSRIAPVRKTDENAWRVYLNRSFSYTSLPSVLQESIDRQGIDIPYTVNVRECETDLITLGYHQQDLLQDSLVPCSGREVSGNCFFIEIRFSSEGSMANHSDASIFSYWWMGAFILFFIVMLAVWRVRKKSVIQPEAVHTTESKWIVFGSSRFNPDGLILECGQNRIGLTYREAKLLRLFASHSGELLERENILQQVWGEEGIRVGRSVDMFVSRLRKKLQPDPSVSIVAVHGIGYRMDIEKVSA